MFLKKIIYRSVDFILTCCRLKECFDNQLNVAYSGKTQYDIKWWSENFGADMPIYWPKFEVRAYVN